MESGTENNGLTVNRSSGLYRKKANLLSIDIFDVKIRCTLDDPLGNVKQAVQSHGICAGRRRYGT